MNELRSWAKRFPVAEMKRYHLLDTNPDTDPFHIDALLSFFGVASPESWRSVWEVSHAAYRQTRKFSTNVEAISAWTRAVELEVSEIATEPFDDRKLRSLIPELRRQTRVGAVPLSRERFFDVLSAHQPGRKDAPWKLQVNDMTTPFAPTAAFPKRGLRGSQGLKPVSRLRGTAPKNRVSGIQ